MEDIEKGMMGKTDKFPLPKGCGILITFPDMLFIAELVFGGLVGGLTAVTPINETLLLHAWVLGVSLLCFLGTLTIMIVYAAGAHKNKNIWIWIDVCYHVLAAVLYISAGAVNAVRTQTSEYQLFLHYILNMTSNASALFAILIYCVHAASSLKRKIGQAP